MSATTGKSGGGQLVLDAAAARQLVVRTIMACGWDAHAAGITADNLVGADVTGHASHGIGLLPIYVETVQSGHLDPAATARIARDEPPFVVIDGRRSLGQVAAVEATERAIAVTRAHGIAVVNLIDSHHVGRIGHYGEMTAAAGLLGLFWVNVHGRRATVVPFGARQPKFSTNPHCVAIPRPGGVPFLLDFATAELPVNKVRVAHAKGEKVRLGALVDPDGRPTDDPGVLFSTPRGSIAAFGQHKGSGLALVCELLSSALGGGPQVSDGEDAGAILNNMLAIVIDPARMATGKRDLPTATEQLVGWIKSALPATGVDEVLVPGEPERRARERLAGRLEIDPNTWKAIVAAAQSVGVPAAEIPSPLS